MKKQIHQVILNSLCQKTLSEEICQFHSKTCLSVPPLAASLQNIHSLSKKELSQIEHSESHIYPLYSRKIDLDYKKKGICRQPSARHFTNHAISDSSFEELLSESFGAFYADSEWRREYPSGGAMYAVELFIAVLSPLKNYQPGIYHYLPLSNSVIQVEKSAKPSFFEAFTSLNSSPLDLPKWVFIYVLNIAKSTCKYKYRGYRHSLMEAGSMYQQAGMLADKLGLKHCVVSSFNDYEINRLLFLKTEEFLPLVLQYFG